MAEFTYGPGSESVHVQVMVPGGTSRWDQVVWGPAGDDVGIWSGLEWQTVDCQITEAAWTWACQRDVGILSVAEAGSLDLQTFDPDRQLDPANVTGPFFRQVHPGTPIRILGPNLPVDVEGMPEDLGPVWTGWVDELTYDVASQTGRLRCIDPIALMAQTAYRDAGLPSALPNTLRARIRRVLVDAQLDHLVPFRWLMLFEDGEWEEDPPVAPFVAPTGNPPNVWKVIQDACADALWLAWVDAAGQLQISDWVGAFPNSPISLGCGPAEDDPSNWVEYLTTIEFEQTAEGIRNRVVAKEGGIDASMEDRQSVLKYGVREYAVDRAVPDRVTWGQLILDDRADASLTVNAVESRPADAAELSRLLDFLRVGPSQTRLRDDQHPPLIDLEVTLIGMSVRVSPDGWVFSCVTSLSRGAFEALEPLPAPDGYINIVQEAEGEIGDPSGSITLPGIPVPGNHLLLWHAVRGGFGATPPGFIAHPSGPVHTGGTFGSGGTGDLHLVQSKFGLFDGGAATTLTFDTPPVAGNLLVAVLSERGGAGGGRTGPSGWSAATEFIIISNDRETLWHRAAPGGAVTVTVGGATNHRRMVIMEFDGPAALLSAPTKSSQPAASSHPVGPVVTTDWQTLLVGYVGAYDTGGGRHTTMINDPLYTLIDRGEMQGNFAPAHIVSSRVVPPGSYLFSPTSDQGPWGGVQWGGTLVAFRSTIPAPAVEEAKGQWFWRRVLPGDGPTVTGIRDAAGNVGVARLLELENVVSVAIGPSASGDSTSPFSIGVTTGSGARTMGGIVYAYDPLDGDEVLAPLATNVEEWEGAAPFGPVGSVVYHDQLAAGTVTIGESVVPVEPS